MTQNEQKFFEAYRRNLRKAVQTRPDVYFFGENEVDKVADKMIAAVQQRTFNKDGLAFKWTCKELGINHTYKDITRYLVAQ